MKKKATIILSLFYNIIVFSQSSYSEIKYDIIEEKENTIVKFENMGLITNCNSELINRFIYFSNNVSDIKSSKPIDTINCSPYGYNIRLLKSELMKDYVLIFESIEEYDSEIKLYYISNGLLFKMGDLNLQTDCKNCDSFNYPIDKIVFKSDGETITINFILPVKYKTDKTDWKLYQPNDIELKYNKIKNRMSN